MAGAAHLLDVDVLKPINMGRGYLMDIRVTYAVVGMLPAPMLAGYTARAARVPNSLTLQEIARQPASVQVLTSGIRKESL